MQITPDPTHTPLAPQRPAPEHPPVETTLAETDARYYSVQTEVPSQMTTYDFNLMSVRPYQLPEMIKLGAASRSGKLRYVVEAVGATTDRPVMGLTMMDFTYLCYWLRLMSYKTKPFTVFWSCEASVHYQEVMAKRQDEKTLQNQTVMTRSELVVNLLDVEKIAPITKALVEQHSIAMQAPTVADFLEALEVTDWTDEETYLIRYAGCLHTTHGRTLRDRCRFLANLPPETGGAALELLSDARRVIDQAGVVERVTATCNQCGEVQEVALSVDLLSFFPLGN